MTVAEDFNVDVSERGGKWLVDYMRDVHSLKCVSAERKLPTTIRGTCIDLICGNLDIECVQEPLRMHFSNHKAVVVKAKRFTARVHSKEMTRIMPAITLNKSSSHFCAFETK